MAFDIDKMKADGVSPHLIELAELSERNDTAAFEKIAMGLENTEIFRQFISMEANAPAWDYMYAAGLCTKAEADWLKDPNNPYSGENDNIVTVTYAPNNRTGNEFVEAFSTTHENGSELTKSDVISDFEEHGTSITSFNYYFSSAADDNTHLDFPITLDSDTTIYVYIKQWS